MDRALKDSLGLFIVTNIHFQRGGEANALAVDIVDWFKAQPPVVSDERVAKLRAEWHSIRSAIIVTPLAVGLAGEYKATRETLRILGLESLLEEKNGRA